MIFYVKYNNEIFKYKNLCPALSFIKYIGGELYFKKPKTIIQKELFNE